MSPSCPTNLCISPLYTYMISIFTYNKEKVGQGGQGGHQMFSFQTKRRGIVCKANILEKLGFLPKNVMFTHLPKNWCVMEE